MQLRSDNRRYKDLKLLLLLLALTLAASWENKSAGFILIDVLSGKYCQSFYVFSLNPQAFVAGMKRDAAAAAEGVHSPSRGVRHNREEKKKKALFNLSH